MKTGIRLLAKQPIMSVAIVLTLSVGIGLAATGFTVLSEVTLGRFRFDPDRHFVQVFLERQGRGLTISWEMLAEGAEGKGEVGRIVVVDRLEAGLHACGKLG